MRIRIALERWKLHSSFSADSRPISAQGLAVAVQWGLGLGAEKTLENNMELGLVYQYQSLYDGEISNSLFGNGLCNNSEYTLSLLHCALGFLYYSVL